MVYKLPTSLLFLVELDANMPSTIFGIDCSSDRYMINLYCLALQAGFYIDMVECSPVTQTARV